MINYIENYTEGNKLDILKNEITWQNIQFARGECFMSDDNKQYQYIENGPIYNSMTFHYLVKDLMIKINSDFNYKLDVCFLNYYEDQTKALGWHADDSHPIDQSQPIAVISFGAEREIWWKPMDYKGIIPQEWRQLLKDGSLFIMEPGMQNTHKHRIPKNDRPCGSRISLTYRCWKK